VDGNGRRRISGVDGVSACDGADGKALRIERRGAAGLLTLERPAELNAICGDMRRGLIKALAGFGRDPGVYAVVLRSAVAGVFSIGSDLSELLVAATADLAAARRAVAETCVLCWTVECFSKPTVSLLEGRATGAGTGIALYGTHRVAGEHYRFSLPATRIGYFPDAGLARALAAMPDGIGLYLALTGREIGRADALALGLVTHCIACERFGEIEAALADAEPVDPVLDDRHEDPGPAQLLEEAARIRRYFAAPTLADCIARLKSPEAGDRAFAEQTLMALAERSPMALAVTERLIRRAASLDIQATLRLDYRIGSRLIEHPDFGAGVRALVVELAGSPSWSPARIEDVTSASVERFFMPRPDGELALPDRAAMQAPRA